MKKGKILLLSLVLLFCNSTPMFADEITDGATSLLKFESTLEDGRRVYISESPQETEEIMELIQSKQGNQSSHIAPRATGYTSVYEKIGGMQKKYILTKSPTNIGAGNTDIAIPLNKTGGTRSHTVSLSYRDFKVSYKYATSGPGDGYLTCPVSDKPGKKYCGIGTSTEMNFQQYQEYQIPHSQPGTKYKAGITTSSYKIGEQHFVYFHSGDRYVTSSVTTVAPGTDSFYSF